MAQATTKIVKTTHAQVFVRHVTPINPDPDQPALLFLHGNSCSSRAFQDIIDSLNQPSCHIFAIDYPGHGQSSDAVSPEDTYSMPGYARVAAEVLRHYSSPPVIAVGWSLGGHVGIELINLLGDQVRGLMIQGTPPIPRGEPTLGFGEDAPTLFAFRDDLSQEEKIEFAHGMAAPMYEDWVLENVYRTDPQARLLMYQAMDRGDGVDQKELMETTDVLVAVVNGADDPFVLHDYIKTVEYKNLWKGKCVDMPGLKHAPFWEKPSEFTRLLLDFLADASHH